MKVSDKVKLLVCALRDNEIVNFTHTKCTTNGESHYFVFMGENFHPVMKVRVSDHSVTNHGRLTDEFHFHGEDKQIQRIIEVAKSWQPDYLLYFDTAPVMKYDSIN